MSNAYNQFQNLKLDASYEKPNHKSQFHSPNMVLDEDVNGHGILHLKKKKKMLYETKSKKTFPPQAIPVLLADVVTHPHKHTHTHTNQPTRYLDTKKGSTEPLKMHVPVVS